MKYSPAEKAPRRCESLSGRSKLPDQRVKCSQFRGGSPRGRKASKPLLRRVSQGDLRRRHALAGVGNGPSAHVAVRQYILKVGVREDKVNGSFRRAKTDRSQMRVRDDACFLLLKGPCLDGQRDSL